MRAHLLTALMLASPGAAYSQALRLDDRPLVTAQGAGTVQHMPDWVRVGFTVRGEGTTPVEALSSMARQRAVVLASIRASKGMGDAEISDGSVSTQEVRNPACSPNQPYLAQQRLSTGECAIAGAITNIELDVKVRPATRAGDVASLASQLGAKNVSLRGSGFDHDEDVQAEAAQRAVADARREADLIARAAGGRLGELLRVQDQAAFNEVVVTGSRGVPPSPPPPPPLPLPPTPAPVPQSVLIADFKPQPLTRTARVTLIFALATP